jgi:3',5'-cyclic AMP phosphodiesterase CpdA
MSVEIRIAHLSDWHATSLKGGGGGLLRPKRLSGWASWWLNRRHMHSSEVLAAAIEDVRRQSVDRILVSGDLTHVSLESEFHAAAHQLEALGTPERVFLIPGNHDCYVAVPPERSWDHWAPYLHGALHSDLEPALARCLAPKGPRSRAPRFEEYPTLRLHGRLAVVGLCSAIPTPIFRAGGRLGAVQLHRLERLLAELRAQGFARVVMVHHPVVAADEARRRSLWDAEALREVLAREGAELVLHGHKHSRRVNSVAGPVGEIPVIGVPSSSEVGSRPDRCAQYHLYTLCGDAARPGFRIEAEIRGYDPVSGAFVHVEEALF